MLTEAQIEKKLFEQAEMFMHHMKRKEYVDAALCVDWAAMVSRFVELDEQKKAELFGNRQADETVDGLINEELYLKACEWCIFKGGYAVTRHTYQNVQKLRQKNGA